MASGKLGTGLPLRLGAIDVTTSSGTFGFGQAQADIKQTYRGFGQAQAYIKRIGQAFGQAQASIVYKRWAFGQATAWIKTTHQAVGQAQADIQQTYQAYAQAQALIVVRGVNAFGQARASIVYKRWAFAQAQATIVRGNPGGGDGGGDGSGGGPSNFGPPEYVVVYNGFQLPGYPQSETHDLDNQLDSHPAFGWDGSDIQQAGLSNSSLSMDFLIYNIDGWHTAKDRFHMAERILLSHRGEFAPLYIDYTDRHWTAAVAGISYEKDATGNRKVLQYTVHWEVQPWVVAEDEHVITGSTGILTTADRTLNNGAWTPTKVEVSGTDITISGYTDTEFTGYISIEGTVNNMVIDTEAYTAEIGGVSAVDKMQWVDFALFVGVGETKFDVTGASSIRITYRDRWY